MQSGSRGNLSVYIQEMLPVIGVETILRSFLGFQVHAFPSQPLEVPSIFPASLNVRKLADPVPWLYCLLLSIEETAGDPGGESLESGPPTLLASACLGQLWPWATLLARGLWWAERMPICWCLEGEVDCPIYGCPQNH